MKTFRLKGVFLTVLLGLFAIFSGVSQVSSVKFDLFSMSKTNKLEVFNRTVTALTDNDRMGTQFSKKENDGIAWLNGVTFSNGTIELDIRGKDEFQQSFVGVAFHGIDNNTLDAVYFRPFNFQATDPVRKIHAVQYISHPDYPWQVLREKFNGKYEKAITPSPRGNEWFHVKIVIRSPLITVYVNSNPEACLNVEKLNKHTTGKIGLWVGNNSDGDFANLIITPQD